MSSPSDQPATNGQEAAVATCPNCGEPRPRPFCAECGQNDRDYRRSSWAVVGDFLRETFEVDSKVFRTLKLLLKPGRLSAEFSRNRRVRYVSPVRLYLFASVIYFFAVGQAQPGGGQAGPVETDEPSAVSDEVADQAPAAGGSSSPSLPTQADIDALKAWLPPETASKLDDLMLRPDQPELVGFLLQVTGDLPSRLPNEAGRAERLWWVAVIGFLHDPGYFQDQIVGSLSVGAIFFVPVAALMLALVYFRKQRYFAEHLVLQIHIQTFSFLLTSVAVSLPAGTFGALGRTALGGWALYYGVATLKHFYGDGWLRTLFKVFLLMLLNAVLVTPVLFATIALRM